MLIKVLSDQIPLFWEAIKFAVVQTGEVTEKDIPFHLNKLLYELLNDKAQCFVRLDEKRTLTALMVTKINIDKITTKKNIFIECMYSFKAVDNEIWEENYKILYDFAVQEKCENISFVSNNERVWGLSGMLGFKEVNRTFSLEVN